MTMTLQLKALLALLVTTMFQLSGVEASAQQALPRPEGPFKGTIGRTVEDFQVRLPEGGPGRERGAHHPLHSHG